MKYEYHPLPYKEKTPARTDVRWWRTSTRLRAAERDVEEIFLSGTLY